MPNYNIQVVVDPSGSNSGIQVVESGLEKLSTKAKKTKGDIQGAFDFSSADAANKISTVDKALDAMGTSATASGKQIETALTKAEAAAARANGRLVNSQAQVRQSTLSLGQQFNDFSTQVLSGGSVVTAFAQQSGQAAFALQGMNGALGTVGRFLAGPWGTIAIIATTVLAGFVTKLIQQNDELDKVVDKLKKDAKETETARQAKDIYRRSTEGVYEAIRELNAETGKSIKSTREQETATLAAALANRNRAVAIREELQAQLEQRRDQARGQLMAAQQPNQRGEMAALGLSAAQKAVDEAEAALTRNQAAVTEAQQSVRNATISIAARAADDTSTAAGRVNLQYDRMKEAAIAAARGNDQLTRSLAGTLGAIERQRQASLEAQREERSAESRGDGVSRFTSRAQALGVAGRELQGAGLRVSENEQFGGITPGVHSSTHRNAIDVNVGRGVTEANVPDLKSRFDQLARSYQARGYRVIWNGRVYAPGGDGPGGTAAGHQDHLHLEAPQTIVGRATQASTGQQQLTELRQFAQQVEQERDFIDSVVDRASARGPDTVAGAAAAEIERVAQDFQRRFNRALSTTERSLVEGAINSAVASETAEHFDKAYNEPLRRLIDLQGQTGLGRQVLNAQLAETARLGRELTPAESQQIENSVRRGDSLQREARLLEEVRSPLEEYTAAIVTLNDALLLGDINQTSFNSRVADLGRSARYALSGLPGADPVSGQSYADVAAEAEESARYARELELYQNNRGQLLQLGISYNGLVEAAQQRHVDNLNNIDRSRRQVALVAAQSTFDSLTQIAAAGFGEQSAVYKAMFTVSKAFAIAQSVIAIQQGIAETLKLPFPANLAAAAGVAAQAASIVSNIQAVSLAFADGGYVRGPGGPRSDSVPARLSNGEFVVNAAATSRNRNLLEAINSGQAARPSGAAGGDGGVVIQTGDIIVNGAGGDGAEIGREVRLALTGIVRQELGAQRRSGGALTKAGGSVMAGG